MRSSLIEIIKSTTSENTQQLKDYISGREVNNKLQNTFYPLQYACWLKNTTAVQILTPLSSDSVKKLSLLHSISLNDLGNAVFISNSVSFVLPDDLNVFAMMIRKLRPSGPTFELFDSIIKKTSNNTRIILSTVLVLAIELGDVEWCSHIIRVQNVSTTESLFKVTPLMHSLSKKNYELSRILLENVLDEFDDTQLINAVSLSAQLMNEYAYVNLMSMILKKADVMDNLKTLVLNTVYYSIDYIIKHKQFLPFFTKHTDFVLSMLYSIHRGDHFYNDKYTVMNTVSSLEKVLKFNFKIRHTESDEPLLAYLIKIDSHHTGFAHESFKTHLFKYESPTISINTNLNEPVDVKPIKNSFDQDKRYDSVHLSKYRPKTRSSRHHRDNDSENSDRDMGYDEYDDYDPEDVYNNSVPSEELARDKVLDFHLQRDSDINPILKDGRHLLIHFIDSHLDKTLSVRDPFKDIVNDPYLNMFLGSLNEYGHIITTHMTNLIKDPESEKNNVVQMIGLLSMYGYDPNNLAVPLTSVLLKSVALGMRIIYLMFSIDHKILK
ncbi:putative ankyrin domain containg protein [Yasminevirus sp. GU-2018]|uniref:Putative ankyrin domain containg protein n=1 Tax=Yasminevirus sp. GU-2018 TaxID=2420051 RepID=A0A5K0UB08_9VIRU|nr:putative ankyrin domain containg protein [Yasminevirus sp. GU-2018]